ncbi:uncharacterized protein LOC143024874 isoform X2 [Oratosquilla oratoria]
MSNQLENSLLAWATSITQKKNIGSHGDYLTAANFTMLTGNKNQKAVLEYLMKHVKSPGERRHIRLNLKLSHLKEERLNTKGSKPMTRDQKLFKEKLAVVTAQTDVKAHTSDIEKLRNYIEELNQKEETTNKKNALISVSTAQRQKQIKSLQNWSKQLQHILPDRDLGWNKGRDDGHDPSDYWTLQTHFHNLLLDLHRLRRHLIVGDGEHLEREHPEKLQICEAAENLSEDWRPQQLLSALLHETQQSTEKLRQQVLDVDLIRDARQHRLKCENDGTFLDNTNPSGVIESMQELLGHMGATHVRLYLQAQKARQTSLSLQSTYDSLYSKVESITKEAFKDEAVMLAGKGLLEARLDLACKQGVLHTLQVLTEVMQSRADDAVKARDDLKAKLTKIKHFDTEVLDGTSRIQGLAIGVSEGWQASKNCVGSVSEEIASTMTKLPYPTPAIDSLLLSTQLQTFTSIPLAQLMEVPIRGSETVSKSALSTCSLVWHNLQDKAPDGTGTMSWDAINAAAVNSTHLKRETDVQLQRLAAMKQGLNNNLATKRLTSTQVREMCKKVEDHDASEQKQVIPLLDQCAKKVKEVNSLCNLVETSLDVWWTNPALKIKL